MLFTAMCSFNKLNLFYLSFFIRLSCRVNAQFFIRPEYYPQNVMNSILTPFLIKNECHTSADNRVGICMPKATCLGTGGIVTGNCGFLSSCCIYQGTCKSVVTANETYFVSPNYPEMQSARLDPPLCIFTLQRANLIQKLPVCQIRIDFDEFSLAPPVNGRCGDTTDSFLLSGAANFNASGLPSSGLCGELTGQHVHVDVDPDDTGEPLLFIVNTGNDEIYNRKWSIRIRQIPCHSPFKAISGCLQHYNGLEGVIESFNFRGLSRTPHGYMGAGVLGPMGNTIGGGMIGGGLFGPTGPVPGFNPAVGPIGTGIVGGFASGSSPNYLNGMSYGVCVSLQPGYCAIRYEAVEFDFGGSVLGQSCVGNDAGQAGCFCTISNSLQDTGDYLLLPGGSSDGIAMLQNQFCGQRLNPRANQVIHQPIMSFFKPFVFYVRSDDIAETSISNPISGEKPNQKGFQIKYQQIRC